jgi:hypothetical protein
MSDIAELFSRDPLNLTKENIDEIIKYYREKRALFNLGDKTAGNTKKMKAEPKIKASAEELLKGLGLLPKV